MNRNLCKQVLSKGGSLTPLLIPSSDSKGLGLMNPSIFVDKGQLILNLRNVNYTLYHCEKEQIFNNRYGPLVYLNPENDIHLRTTNFFCTLNEDFSVKESHVVDTSKLDIEPVWEFIGLEDARLVRWDSKLFMCGVRRDTKTNGEGRMELSEIIVNKTFVKERSRKRIQPPNDPNSYCEKNWMPILDMPFHFVKWSNPTEVVKVDLETQTSKTVFISNKTIPDLPFLRGSSQVIKYGDYRICLVHDCNLFHNRMGQKDATYLHRFIIWDLNWNIIKITDAFSFMDGEIEFCCGLAIYKEDLLISFGFQDNAAYVLKIPNSVWQDILEIKKSDPIKRILEITTAIPKNGCPIDCTFCPQSVLIKSYSGNILMTLPDFKIAIDKLSTDIDIIFAGFSEPWLNKHCTDMILYANNKGHKISVFTTGIGMSMKDVEAIKDIQFATGPNKGFVVHLPDKEGYAKHIVTLPYIAVLQRLKEVFGKFNFFYTVCMGEVVDEIKDIFSNTVKQQMWSRAGNLSTDYGKNLTILDNCNFAEIKKGDCSCNCEEGVNRNVLLPNGDLVLCCMDYALQHKLGNLFTQDYEDILPKQNTPFELCKFCENGKLL